MATCSTDTLLEEGRCFQCANEQQFWQMALQLLCDIQAEGGGGGGSSAIYQGAGVPAFFPLDPDQPALYTNLTDGVLFTWSVPLQAWI